jgi:hypothetical protein
MLNHNSIVSLLRWLHNCCEPLQGRAWEDGESNQKVPFMPFRRQYVEMRSEIVTRFQPFLDC